MGKKNNTNNFFNTNNQTNFIENLTLKLHKYIQQLETIQLFQ